MSRYSKDANGNWHLIAGTGNSAEDITYDNTASGLTSDNVQNAIDEVLELPPQYSNPNLLDNPWFTVNQRGASSYSADWVYTADRWLKGECYTLNIGENGISISNLTAAYGYLSQRIPLDFYDYLVGKKCTLSIMKSTGEIIHVSGTVLNTGTSFWFETSEIWFGLVRDSNFATIGLSIKSTSISIKAVKLELGSVSTLANDTAPNYAEELLKCQRYFYRLSNIYNYDALIGYGAANTVNSFSLIIDLPTVMRISPSIQISNINNIRVLDIDNSFSDRTPTSISGNSFTGSARAINVVSSGAYTIGHMYQVHIKGGTNGYIDFSADL